MNKANLRLVEFPVSSGKGSKKVNEELQKAISLSCIELKPIKENEAILKHYKETFRELASDSYQELISQSDKTDFYTATSNKEKLIMRYLLNKLAEDKDNIVGFKRNSMTTVLELYTILT